MGRLSKRVINQVKKTESKKKRQTMKKNLFKTRLLSFAAFCGLALAFASCANEDVAQGTTGTETDNDKNLTTFVAGDEAKTRTSMDYTSGDFYWEAGDYIYVKDDDGTWQKSSNAPTSKVASFKFKVPGKFTASTSYKVYYPGKNGSNDQVTIPAAQTQATPNTTTHFGESGDCGTATATGTVGGGSFSFALDHQAAILVFQPYNSNTELNDCYLTKIEVTSDNNITGTYTLNSSTGELTGTGSGKQITLNTTGSGAYANGFPVKTTSASVGTNGAYMLIQPGTHALKVRYWVKDVLTNVEGVITKDLSSFVYDKNTYYDMALNMNLKDYKTTRCYWDAQADYWVGHEWNAANPADRWQPVITAKPFPHYDELKKPVTPPRAANLSFPGLGVRNDAVNLCKDCPNVNELVWYAEKGDPRFDADILWTCMGHLRKGGIWLKKKAKIASDNGKTISDIENKAPDNTDWRITTSALASNQKSTNLTPPSSGDINDYFFLPALGSANDDPSGKIFSMTGQMASFWSSSGVLNNIDVFALVYYINSNNELELSIASTVNRELNIMNAWKFE